MLLVSSKPGSKKFADVCILVSDVEFSISFRNLVIAPKYRKCNRRNYRMSPSSRIPLVLIYFDNTFHTHTNVFLVLFLICHIPAAVLFVFCSFRSARTFSRSCLSPAQIHHFCGPAKIRKGSYFSALKIDKSIS